MKIRIISVLFVLFNFGSIIAQVTKEPYVSYTNAENTVIESVSITSNNTIVYLTYWKTKSNRYQSWVSFSRNTFLIDRKTGLKFRINSISNNQQNLLFDTRYSTTGRKGKVKGDKTTYWVFYLDFPKLPPGVEEFDIVEEIPSGNGFKWLGITIKNPDILVQTSHTERSLKNNWKLNGLDKLEGIYENSVSSKMESKYKIAILKDSGVYSAIYLSGSKNEKWREGMVKANFVKTATPNFFKTKWYMEYGFINENVYSSFIDGGIKFMFTEQNQERFYVKLFPSFEDEIKRKNTNQILSTGTGFIVHQNGYVVTNYHVVEDAQNIFIRGINGDFQNKHEASVLYKDQINDLCLLKINDMNDIVINSIPYIIDEEIKSVGESIFSLGYPLLSTMGEEIKLTNGIISSKTGFKGDVTMYQTNVAVQPGNSGGPMFDSNGNIIGVVKARHSNAENASYVIKSSYVKTLVQLIDEKNNEASINMSQFELSKKVDTVKNYIYIIEVY